MRTQTWTSLVVFLFIATSGLSLAQTVTIPEQVERVRPGPLVIRNISEPAVPSFDAAVRDSVLIVRGTLTKLSTYLSDDQTTLYTDYRVAVSDVIVSRPPQRAQKRGPVLTPPLSVPGQQPTRPIILRAWGGDTTINGVAVNIYNDELLPLPTDQPLLLLLSFNNKVQKYEIYAQGAYAFHIENGNVLKPLVRHASVLDARLIGTAVAEVITAIHERVR